MTWLRKDDHDTIYIQSELKTKIQFKLIASQPKYLHLSPFTPITIEGDQYKLN